ESSSQLLCTREELSFLPCCQLMTRNGEATSSSEVLPVRESSSAFPSTFSHTARELCGSKALIQQRFHSLTTTTLETPRIWMHSLFASRITLRASHTLCQLWIPSTNFFNQPLPRSVTLPH